MIKKYDSLKALKTEWLPICQIAWEEMNIKLSDEPVIVEEQGRTAEGYYARLTVCLAEAESLLDFAELKNLQTREAGTELERKIWLAAAVRDERSFRDAIEGLVKAIEIRVNMTQSLLKYHKPFKGGE